MARINISMVPGSPFSEEKQRLFLDLTRRVGEARESLDCAAFLEMLAEDVVYEAQEGSNPLVGKAAVSEYLIKRFDFLQKARDNGADTGRLRLGVVDMVPAARHPCLVIEAEGLRRALWVCEFDRDRCVRRIDIFTVSPCPDDANILDC